MRHKSIPLSFLAAIALVCAPVVSAETRKILFVAGKPSHGWNMHEHAKGCTLLATALNESGLAVEAVVHTDTWPQDASAFADIACLVIYADGGGGHVARGRAKQIADLSKKGVGIACLHYALEPPGEELGRCFLDCLGGYFAVDWSVNPTWTPNAPRVADHPVGRGVQPFELKDEWYYHMRFRPDMKGVTPVLSAHPPAGTLAEKDGPRRGNPALRKELADGVVQHLAWVSVNEGGSRGFGFTGGHWHTNWACDDFRTLVLNGIAWAAKIEIPEKGVPSETPVIVRNKSILHAIARGDAEDVKRYLQKGAKLNEKNAAGWTPLHYAAVRGKAAIAKLLIAGGADVNVRNNSKRIPLHHAAERNYLELAKVLVKHGSQLDARERDGWSPLHYAAMKDHVEMAAFLIEKGASVNLISARGGTPLHEASATASAAMTKLLLKHGADKSIKAKNGKTALDYAVELKNEPVEKILRGK